MLLAGSTIMRIMTAQPELPAAAVLSRSDRITTLIFDGIGGLVGIGGVTYLVVSLASPLLAGWGLALLAAWTAVLCLMALPAIAILHFSTPRVPLKQRSALIASASWFGRAVWAAAVFAVSIVVGAVAGVVASDANESGREGGVGIGLAIEATASLVLWPSILTVVAVAYVVVGVRWVLDLGTIVAEDGGAVVRALLERRWTGPLQLSPRAAGLLNILLELGIAGISRIALVLTLVTVGLNVVLAATSFR
jgi:hypothetical protein